MECTTITLRLVSTLRHFLKHRCFLSELCDGPHCYILITIVNYYLESCLICIVIDAKASCLLIVIVKTTIVAKT